MVLDDAQGPNIGWAASGAPGGRHPWPEAYNFKLGAALKMEEKVLDILESSADEAQDEKVAALFRQHHEESQAHVKNLEEVSPCSAGRSTLDTVKRVQEQVAAVTPKQPA